MSDNQPVARYLWGTVESAQQEVRAAWGLLNRIINDDTLTETDRDQAVLDALNHVVLANQHLSVSQLPGFDEADLGLTIQHWDEPPADLSRRSFLRPRTW